VTEAKLEEIDSDPLAVLVLVPEAEDVALATVVKTEPSASDVASLASDLIEEEAEASFEEAEPVRAVSTLRRQSL
jgi:hypothetical protein